MLQGSSSSSLLIWMLADARAVVGSRLGSYPRILCELGFQPAAWRVFRVRAGPLDDTSWLRPTRHIWTRSKQPCKGQQRTLGQDGTMPGHNDFSK
jgi:hypothetical protein